MSKDKKKEILEMLANKEISKEEAERKLAEIGGKVTTQEPDPVQKPQPAPKKSNTGCLIAIIIAVILLPILLVIFLIALFLVLWKADASDSYRESYRVPEAYEIHKSTDYISADPKEIKPPEKGPESK